MLKLKVQQDSHVKSTCFVKILNMNRQKEMWRESPDILNPRFNTHLATGLVAIGFTGIVLGELSPFLFQCPDRSL